MADLASIERSLGSALGKWGVVEKELFLLYLHLCPKIFGRIHHHQLVYRNIGSFLQRRRVVAALIEDRDISPEINAEWKRINKLIESLHRSRNGFAHWIIAQEKGDVFLLNDSYVLTGTKDGPSDPDKLDAVDIDKSGDQFLALAKRIERFRRDRVPQPSL